jgi:DNA invertase Pin-like site-specific DNA recombinase
MTTKIQTVALYARISTNEKRQNIMNQITELRAYARRMRWKVVKEFHEEKSGAADNRPIFEALMHAASQRKFDAVVVTDLSRMTRKGPSSAFAYIERLNSCGVEFWSVREEHFRTPGPAGALMIAIAAFIAAQERDMMRARINAGIERAKRQGVHCGRPRVAVSRASVERLRNSGMTIRAIAASLGTSKGTIERKLGEL